MITRIKHLLSHKKIIVGIILLCIIGFVIYKNTSQKPKDTDFAKAKRADITATLTLSGEIKAEQHVSVGFQTSGLVTSVLVKEGDTVTQNQLIATLDQKTVLKNLQKTLLDYSEQRNTFDQTHINYQERKPEQALNDAMKRILQNNQYDLDKAVVSVELQDLAKQQTLLFAPIAGIVTNTSKIQPGIFALATQTPFTIVNPDTVYFEITIDQTELSLIQNGSSGTIVFDSFPEEKIKGTVNSVSFAPDPTESGTVYPVKISLQSIKNGYPSYRLGMTGDITFITDQKKNVITIPTEFIKTDEKGKYVLRGDKKEKTRVEIGIESDLDTEIISGLQPEDTVWQ